MIAEMKKEKPFVFWQLVHIKAAVWSSVRVGVIFDIHENEIKISIDNRIFIAKCKTSKSIFSICSI